MAKDKKILYCRCSHYQLIDRAVSDEVLWGLGDSGESFEAVSDLCVASARKDILFAKLNDVEDLRIAACNARAVRCLFEAGGSGLPANAVVVDMKTNSAHDVLAALLDGEGESDV